MSLLLVFGGVSKEYLHLFTGHTDTIDHQWDGRGLHLESEHHHCTFLSFTLPPYMRDAQEFSFTPKAVLFSCDLAEDVAHLVPRDVPVSRLRGPPAPVV